ncbi:MAG: SDR family oxidoreductase [Bacteroidota bacterium]|nr:SDR family oxidoreductase [Bacteroidota bacterium]MDP4190055.1 SDR family oxidoreductase [Bacteroidota bacterium]MDP4194959.1 SDR family oxidoreductase [Bacteroidota bacterium]
MVSLKNKIVFITGATSGIGKNCAIEFAREGANLILCSRRVELLNAFSEELIKEFGIKVYSFQLDVRDEEAVNSAVKAFPEEWKSIDILINNAGLARGFAKLYEDDTQNWNEMIDTNVKGLLYVTRAVVPAMAKRNNGHIINIGSIAGHEAYPNGGAYCATKHAVDAITKSLRMDLADKNIRVSTIDPGLVETNFSVIRFHGDEDRAKNVYKGITPLSGKDIAETIVFIATRPAHVNLAQIVIFPTHQASSTIVHREDL